jgi:SAM-dependent methyltransferase
MAGANGTSLQERFATAQWTAPNRFRFGGAEFGLVDLGEPRPEPPTLTLKKPRSFLETYVDVLEGQPIRNVLELGLNHGGSATFFAALLEPQRLVSIDLSGPVARFDAFRGEHPLGRLISAHYRTSQDDAARLAEILASEFDGPVDLVLDDASHSYGPTRASFEILFPRIRPGGWFVIEDWQWAHAPGFTARQDETALSNLVFQVLMICAGRPDLIAEVRVFQGLAFVRKGEAPASEGRLDLERLYTTQGREFRPL